MSSSPSPGERANRIFLSYRRSDSAGYAGRLSDGLRARFGGESVFMDVAAIPGGAHFPRRIEEAIQSADVLLVVIGPSWFSAQDESGSRRLDDPDDYVRHEVELGLARDMPVVPVLVGGAQMPAATLLPPALRELAFHNAMEASDGRWERDLDEIAEAIRRWAPSLSASASAPPRGRLALRVGMVAAALAALVLGGMLAVQLLRGRPEAPPVAPMVGDLNVVVAEFTETTADGSARLSGEGRELAKAVHELLSERLTALSRADGGGEYLIAIRSPQEAGPILGASGEERARKAAELASASRADLVIYGSVRADQSAASFIPEIYVSDRQLRDSEELAGQYELGSRLTAQGSFETNPATRRSLREQLSTRVIALVQFSYGLGYYAQGDLRRALDHFQASAASPSWADCSCSYILEIFLANTLGRSGRLAEAGEHYQIALVAEPEAARAHIGAAEVQFLTSARSCRIDDVDAAGLEQALVGYQRALKATIQPALSNIRAKVALRTARVQLCLSQAQQGDYWDTAKQSLEEVVRELRAGNERLQHQAAEAYGLLGLIALPTTDGQNREAAYRAALEQYQEAIRVSPFDDRKAVFNASIGFIHSRLGDLPAANKAMDEAIRLDPRNRERYERQRAQFGTDSGR